jgi:hypothetical protein
MHPRRQHSTRRARRLRRGTRDGHLARQARLVDGVDDAVSGQVEQNLAASRCEPVASLTTRGPSVDECLSTAHPSAGPRVPYERVITSKYEELRWRWYRRRDMRLASRLLKMSAAARIWLTCCGLGSSGATSRPRRDIWRRDFWSTRLRQAGACRSRSRTGAAGMLTPLAGRTGGGASASAANRRGPFPFIGSTPGADHRAGLETAAPQRHARRRRGPRAEASRQPNR